MSRSPEVVPLPSVNRRASTNRPANTIERPAQAFSLQLTGLQSRVGVERSTFAIEMLSPVLAALQPDEYLSIDVSPGKNGAAVAAAIGGLARADRMEETSARADDVMRLLEKLVRVQLPGFRARRVAEPKAWPQTRRIVPRGRPLAAEFSADRAAGPVAVKTPAESLQLPPMSIAPERVMAAAQIVAASRTPLALSIRLRLVPLEARILRRVDEARRATEMQDAQTHLEAVRQMADSMPDHRYLSGLMDEGQAVEVTLHALGDVPIDETTERILCHAVFAAPPAADGGAVDEHVHDLVTLYPRGFVLSQLVAGLALTAAFSFQRPSTVYEASQGPGVLLGHTTEGQAVIVADRDRALHMFAIGGTGTGKSTMLLNQLAADMESGKGLILVDPHGDLWEQAMLLVPPQRRKDLISGHLGDPKRSFTMNVLAGLGGDPAIERSATVNSFLRLFTRTLWAGVPEAFGPIFELYFRNAMLTLMEANGDKATFLDFERVFQDSDFREDLLSRVETQGVKDFWNKTASRITYADWSLDNMNPYITSKFAPFTTNALLRPVLGSPDSSLDLVGAIANSKIVLLNLAKGTVGEGSARMVGSLVTMRLVAAAQTQMRLPLADRKAFVAYLDEFQTYATEHVSEAIEETRKYKLSLVLACQSLGQIDGKAHRSDVGRSIVANVANLIAFRLGVDDAQVLARWFEPDFSADDLMYLPNYKAVARLLVDGQALRPVEFCTPPPRQA